MFSCTLRGCHCVSTCWHPFSSRRSFRVGKQSELFRPVVEIENCSCRDSRILSLTSEVFVPFSCNDRVASLSSVHISARYVTVSNQEDFVKRWGRWHLWSRRHAQSPWLSSDDVTWRDDPHALLTATVEFLLTLLRLRAAILLCCADSRCSCVLHFESHYSSGRLGTSASALSLHTSVHFQSLFYVLPWSYRGN
jgi:hypothetical protein